MVCCLLRVANISTTRTNVDVSVGVGVQKFPVFKEPKHLIAGNPVIEEKLRRRFCNHIELSAAR
jgi:hypothetical protein